MEVFDAILTRRSIRKFRKDKEVDDETLRKILTAAIHAPSSGNLQNWEFIVVRDKKKKRALARAALGQSFIEEASVVIVACSNQRRIAYYGDRGRKLYAIQNVAAAVQNMLLAAHALGIGSCWVGAFDESEVARILNLPSYVVPQAIIALGYPAEKPRKPARFELHEIVHEESYGNYWS